MKQFFSFFSTVCIVLFLAFFRVTPALAMEFRTSDNDILITENEMIEGSLFAAGGTIEIDGAIEGDLFCTGQSVIIKGSVGGDVICAGQTIRVDGIVGGNIRSIGQTIDIDGAVSRNVMVVGQTVTAGMESVIEGEGVFGGQTISLLGDIGKSVTGGGNTVLLDGVIGENATIAGNAIQVGSNASIAGTFTYESDKDAVIASTAMVGETVKKPLRREFKEMNKPEKQLPKFSGFMGGKPWPANAVGSILVNLVIGSLAILLFKNGVAKTLGMMKDPVGASFGIGLLWLLIFVPLFIIFLITIIGIPIAFLYAMLFVLSLMLGKLFVAMYIGREIMATYWNHQKENWYGAVAIGVILSWLVFSMPYIGGLTSFLATLWGAGGLVKTLFTKKGIKSERRK